MGSLTQKRLKILGEDEIDALYGRPVFTPAERVEYFALAPPEKAVMEQLHSLTSRLFYILQLGYFKASHLFFVFTLDEVAADANYVQMAYFPTFAPTDVHNPSCDLEKLRVIMVFLSLPERVAIL